jgi:hypothetical protein
MSTDYFDLDKLSLPAGLPVPVKIVRATQRRRAHFVRMPYPWWEKLALARANGPTWAWAFLILYESWRRKGEPFSLLNCAVPGYSRKQKERALAKLEALGLISIKRRRHKPPILLAAHVTDSAKV